MTMAEIKPNILCPSHKCMEGSKLLGIQQIDGKMAILSKPLEINHHEFIGDELHPERSFRFINKCASVDCHQWKHGKCSIAQQLGQSFIDKNESVPDCSIRSQCRWFKQEGIDICRLCPRVVTDVNAEQVNLFFNGLSI
jgi:hypothetical protein